MAYAFWLLILFLVIEMICYSAPAPHTGRITVRRSIANSPHPDYLTCGNCHGTGDDGLGLMPDSEPCEGCGGRGLVKIDPDAKYVSFSEIMKLERLDDETTVQEPRQRAELANARCAGSTLERHKSS